MKILFIGTFVQGAIEFYYENAFKALGCEVRRFDFSPLHSYFFQPEEAGLNRACIRAAEEFKPDLVFVVKGYYLWPNTIDEIKKKTSAQIFCYMGDNPINLMWPGSTNIRILGAIPHYDCYFIWTDALTKDLYAHGARRVFVLPFGFDPAVHYPCPVTDSRARELGSDVVFVGNWDREREFWLKNLTEFDLGVWGAAYWKNRCQDPRLKAAWKGRPLYAQEMSEALGASRISINVLRKQNKLNHNMRTFEAPACGAFVIAERSPECQEFFKEGKEAVYFSSPQELKEKVAYYLAHEDERNEISRAGYQRCLSSGYSYLQRAKQVLATYEQQRTKKTAKYKVAVVASHVIQYAVPFYRTLADHPDIDLTVFFCSDQGAVARKVDPGFGLKFSWDSLSLEHFRYYMLKNYWPFPDLGFFVSRVNPGIFRELRRQRYDAVVVGGYAILTYLLTIIAALWTRTPFILTGEPPTPWKPRMKKAVTSLIKMLMLPFLLRKAAAVYYIGTKAREFYLHYYSKCAPKMFFTPYSVDNDYFISVSRKYHNQKDALKEELGLPKEYPVILYLSKLIYWKRPVFLLEAFRRLKTPATLVFVGSGQRMQLLQQIVRKYNIPRVYLFGFQNYSQVGRFYAVGDLFVLPSLGEAWGLVVNEAMCFSLPVIISDQVMCGPDLVKNGVNGFVVRKENRRLLTEKMDYILSNPDIRARMSQASLEMITTWNYSDCIKGYLQALNHITKR